MHTPGALWGEIGLTCEVWTHVLCNIWRKKPKSLLIGTICLWEPMSTSKEANGKNEISGTERQMCLEQSCFVMQVWMASFCSVLFWGYTWWYSFLIPDSTLKNHWVGLRRPHWVPEIKPGLACARKVLSTVLLLFWPVLLLVLNLRCRRLRFR